MSALLSWFGTPEWSRIVATLLHSLWQGAILSVGLFCLLRLVRRPSARYGLALLTLAGLVASSLITWSVLQENTTTTLVIAKNAARPNDVAKPGETPMNAAPALVNLPGPVAAPDANDSTSMANWSAWLAVGWIVGAAGMLIRAGRQVSGAERVRRSGRPLADGPLRELTAQLQKALGLARPIRVLVTEQLTSPAVTGVLVPVLILPLSLVTTLSLEQLRFILLHELAHIRRRDYLLNLGQLLVEALLFFNPAVWWMSRQIRLEREACCDAVAVELSGAPLEYARTLLQVATHCTQPEPNAAMAFGGTRGPSSLGERIQRLLAPGQRPRLRLTWGATLGSLMAGGTLLVLSALGTRMTVAAILTPEERMDRIEQSLVENGEDLTPPEDQSNVAKIKYSGRVRTEDGSPLPKYAWISSNLQASQYASFGTSDLMEKDGTFHGISQAGQLTLSIEIPGYAPCVFGPITIRGTNTVTGIELVLRRGFAITIQLTDADSGLPIANAEMTADFQTPDSGPLDRKLITDAHGDTRLTNCAGGPVDITCRADGYEIIQKTLNSLSPNESVPLTTRPSVLTQGQVLDKTTGQPIPGAAIKVLHQEGGSERSYDWDYRPFFLAKSDHEGRFAFAGLRQDSHYDLGVTLSGHESVILKDVQAGDSHLIARLGPELIVHGRVTGNIHAAMNEADDPAVTYTVNQPGGNNRRSDPANAWITNGEIQFVFTNRVAGPVELTVAGLSETRMVDGPVADWLMNLTNAPANTNPPTREVVIQLKSSDGMPPRGVINLDDKKMTLHNGAARMQVPVGTTVTYSPDKTSLGFWFDSGFNWTNVPPGTGPLVINVPVIPAGIITARARNAEGSPAGGNFFCVQVLKISPAVEDKNAINFDQGDGFSDAVTPRQYISPPLPLGGKYQIISWRGNSLCASRIVKLTGDAPAQSVELQFTPGQTFAGRVLDPDGQSARGVTLAGMASVNGHDFSLVPIFTDANGEFHLTDCSPEVADYSLDVSQPGFMAEKIKLKFNRQPLTVRLQPGLALGGKVVEAVTGYTIANVQVRVWKEDGSPPSLSTRTDAAGNYEFTTLAGGTYRIFVDGASFEANAWVNGDNKFKAGEVTNLVLHVTPSTGSELTINRPNH